MTNSELFNLMEKKAFELAKDEGLALKLIKRRPRAGTVGTCTYDGIISILIPSSPTMEERVKIQEVGRTIAHELAHLRHQGHGLNFWTYSMLLCMKLSIKLGIHIMPEKVMVSE